MATAKKLPSGSWRCRVYDYTDENGKKHYKSFTSDNPKPAGKREAEAAAAAYAVSKKTAAPRSLTFQAALEAYIEKGLSCCPLPASGNINAPGKIIRT